MAKAWLTFAKSTRLRIMRLTGVSLATYALLLTLSPAAHRRHPSPQPPPPPSPQLHAPPRELSARDGASLLQSFARRRVYAGAPRGEEKIALEGLADEIGERKRERESDRERGVRVPRENNDEDTYHVPAVVQAGGLRDGDGVLHDFSGVGESEKAAKAVGALGHENELAQDLSVEKENAGVREKRLEGLTVEEVRELTAGGELGVESNTLKANWMPGGLPACEGKGGSARAKSWIFVFMGHSGSSAMISELMQHSQVFFEMPEPVDHGEYYRDSGKALEYVTGFFERGVEAGRVPGLKMRPHHLLNPEMRGNWTALAERFDTRIIWQYRENVVKQAVGEYTVRYLNDTSAVEGLRDGMTYEERCKVGAGCRFRIDNFDFFHALLRDTVHNDRLVADAVSVVAGGGKDDCVLALPYEAYLYDRSSAIRKVQEFLGIAAEDHYPNRLKATNDSLCEAVENYQELCREFYYCHSWRALMDDDVNGCYCAKYHKPGWTTRCETVL